MQKIKILLLVLGLWLLAVKPALAIAPTVSIQDLPSYVTTDNFKLSCTALGGSSAQFSFKKEGEPYQDFGSLIDVTTNPCQIQVDSGEINSQTKYYFKVTLDGGISDETSTIYDFAGASPVTGYRKSDGGNNTVIIHWRNPDSEDLAKVIIYRGETVDFLADSNHEIATVIGSPSSEMTYSVNVSDTKTYYSIRAIDKAGNSSSLVGDGSTTTTTTTVTQTQSQNDVSEVRQLPKEATGQVLGEEDMESLKVESTQAPTFVETVAKLASSKIWIFVGGALILLAIVLFIHFNKRRK